MLKHTITIIVLTILAVLFKSFIHIMLNYLLSVHHWLLVQLGHIFSNNGVAVEVKQILAVLLIPLIIGSIVMIFAYILKRRSIIYFFVPIIWAIWLLLITIT